MAKIEEKSAKVSLQKARNRQGPVFWIVFWAASAVLLFAWFAFLEIKNRDIEGIKTLIRLFPISTERKKELQTAADLYQKAGGFSGEQTFLVLFQNNMELRPGGGFIGSFGIIKLNRGRISDIEVHDTGNFDVRIPNTEVPPEPLTKILKLQAWKLRDSNWSPDFRTNAEKAEYFYKLGQGGENFDGIIAINTDVLNSLLAITGPVKINGYPGEYNDETAILQLEYQVEKGYLDQGIEKGERKNILGDLAKILEEKIRNFSLPQKVELAKIIEEHIKAKDIQMFFKDNNLDTEIQNINWGGRTAESKEDYLMAVDANLNSLKSDICIKREMRYEVDLAGETPKAHLEINYEHTCRTADWMTANYRDWLRVYAPDGSRLNSASGQIGDVVFANELGKKVFGMLVYVPIGDSQKITLDYDLPDDFKSKPYSLLIQKQSGSGEVPLEIKIKKADGSVLESKEPLKGDKQIIP
ncbi:MAG: DUF4012 domain-containing protein [Parcubacteria group bacterium]|jgi:hypothetical protein